MHSSMQVWFGSIWERFLTTSLYKILLSMQLSDGHFGYPGFCSAHPKKASIPYITDIMSSEHRTKGGSNMHYNHTDPTKVNVSSLLFSSLLFVVLSHTIPPVVVLSYHRYGATHVVLLILPPHGTHGTCDWASSVWFALSVVGRAGTAKLTV